MAQPDLRAALRPIAHAFHAGDERHALTLLARLRDSFPSASVQWAQLERLHGLLLIHVLREVEGTFALERADAVLDREKALKPDLDWLSDGEVALEFQQ